MNVTLASKMGFDGMVLAQGMENTLDALQIKCTQLSAKYKDSRDVLPCPLLTRSDCFRIVQGCEYYGLLRYPTIVSNYYASVRFALTYPVP
jgi:hypothetical protein